MQKCDSCTSTEINAWGEQRDAGDGAVAELTSGWEMREGACPELGALPPSPASLDIQCAGGPAAPLPSLPLTLDACVSGQPQTIGAVAVASTNSMWQQSTTALGPPLPQAGFHNPSDIPDLLPLGQEVTHSRPLPTLGRAGPGTAVAGPSGYVSLWVYKNNSSHSFKEARITLKSVYELSE